MVACYVFFFFQAEDGIRDIGVTGVQTCALPISRHEVMTVEPVRIIVFSADQAMFPGGDASALEVPRRSLPLDQHANRTLDERLSDFDGHLMLSRHCAIPALLFHLFGNLSGHIAGARSLFLR